jgi:6,7-dimethyl-8-ribityllumazine synthase
LKTRNSKLETRNFRVGIVASIFNQEYVDGMLDSCLKSLGTVPTEIVRVPGAFEIPLAVQRLLEKKNIEAVIALGVIWQGKTAHADLIGSAATHFLMDLTLRYNKPVIHQILMVQNEKQAKERCFGKKMNRGREAAEATLMLLGSEIRNQKSEIYG